MKKSPIMKLLINWVAIYAKYKKNNRKHNQHNQKVIF